MNLFTVWPNGRQRPLASPCLPGAHFSVREKTKEEQRCTYADSAVSSPQNCVLAPLPSPALTLLLAWVSWRNLNSLGSTVSIV